MASNIDFIIKMSQTSSNRVIAYEGTSGDVPWQLQGEYTNVVLAKRALERYLAEVKPESKQEIKVEEVAPIGETSGNSKRKQRI
jgi:hypothetical protein